MSNAIRAEEILKTNAFGKENYILSVPKNFGEFKTITLGAVPPTNEIEAKLIFESGEKVIVFSRDSMSVRGVSNSRHFYLETDGEKKYVGLWPDYLDALPYKECEKIDREFVEAGVKSLVSRLPPQPKLSEIIRLLGQLEKVEAYNMEWYSISVFGKKHAIDINDRAVVVDPSFDYETFEGKMKNPLNLQREIYIKFLSKFFEVKDRLAFEITLYPKDGIEMDIAQKQRAYPVKKVVSAHGWAGHRLYLEDLEDFYKVKAREIDPNVGVVNAGPSDLLHFRLKSFWNELYSETWGISDIEGNVFKYRTSINTDNRTDMIVLCPCSSVKVNKVVEK